MSSLKNESGLPVGVRYEKLSLVADRRLFKICEIKEKEIGVIRKKFIYVHFDGERWSILKIVTDLSKIKIEHYYYKAK